MLKRISIQNFLLIDQWEVEFPNEFVAITGETGSGKSVFVEALSLLAGKRADASLVRHGAKKAVIEGVFVGLSTTAVEWLNQNDLMDDGDSSCIVRRDISLTGRSRVFINDFPASLALLQELAPYLVEVHSQHANMMLKDSLYHVQVLDSMLSDQTVLVEYQSLYSRYSKLQAELKELKVKEQQEREQYDYNLFAYNEIDSFDLAGDSIEKLEDEEQQLIHSEDIQASISCAVELMDGDQGALQQLRQVAKSLSMASGYCTKLELVADRVHSVLIELDDVVAEANDVASDVQVDPKRLDYVTQLINQYNSLLKKYNLLDLEQLNAHKQLLSDKISSVDNFEALIAQYESDIASVYRELLNKGAELHQQRSVAAEVIQARVIDDLKQMEIPDARFVVALNATDEPTKYGCDKPVFLFSANRDLDPKPLSDIASGGEMSRVMLSLKGLNAGAMIINPLLVLDEIDTGLSGLSASRMGGIMRSIARDRQLIVISHLPQVAAKASSHYLLSKQVDELGTTRSRLTLLSDARREQEIARMQSGEVITSSSLNAAKELLEQ